MVAKVPSSKGSSSIASALSTISASELALLSPKSSSSFSPNPLLPLLSFSRHPSPEVTHKAIYALYRVFVAFAEEGRLFATKGEAGKGKDGKESREEVAKWIRERLEEYFEILCGLMRDSEAALRKSSTSILFSLIPALSSALSTHLAASSPPLLSLPHIRTLLRSLLFGASSPRGAKAFTPPTSQEAGSSSSSIPASALKKEKVDWAYVAASQWRVAESDAEEEDVEVRADERIPEDVKVEVVTKLAENDDLRWGFFKELSSLLEHLNDPSSNRSLPTPPPAFPANVLALLLPLNNLPREAEDINTFLCPHLASKPAKKAAVLSKNAQAKKVKLERSKQEEKDHKAAAREPGLDWLAYYDSDEEESDDSEEEYGGAGNKRKRMGGGGAAAASQHKQIWDVASHRKLFTRCWLAAVSLGLSQGETRSVLLVLHSTILPNMIKSKVVRLTDWLGTLVDQGGALALLALNGFYVLMRDYNLEYPQFYQRLYVLMDREVMHVKYRARFFRLTELFLSSPLLPAALVASFIKRLAQLTLTSPPAGIIMIIPFIYNLLKKHPACMMMLQADTAAVEAATYTDPFDGTELDPLKTGALDSSLWELKSLQQHYLSHIATMAKLFQEVFTKPEFLMEDFLDHSYATLFETEMTRKIRSDPALAMEKVENPFPALKEASGEAEEDYHPQESDIVAELWSFGPKM